MFKLKLNTVSLILGSLLLPGVATAAVNRSDSPTAPVNTDNVIAAEIQNNIKKAQQLAEDAYIYGVGPMTHYQLYINQIHNGPWVTNQLLHRREAADHRERGGQAPQTDVLYSLGWVDITDEPLLVSLPDFKDRFYSIQLTDMYNYNFKNIGNDMGYGMQDEYKKDYTFMLVSPDWEGEAPNGVDVVRATGDAISLLFRIYVDPTADGDAQKVNVLQDQISIVPLSNWLAGNKEPDSKEAKLPAIDFDTELDFFVGLNALMTAEPPFDEYESEYVKRFKDINVGPGQIFDEESLDPAIREALLAGIKSGKEKIHELQVNGPSEIINGWQMPGKVQGAYNNDYLQRSATVELGGFVSQPQFNYYMSTYHDEDGVQMNSSNKYVLHFDKDEFPPVTNWWSVTVYGSDFWLHENEINRFSLSNRTAGIELNEDGSLDMYLQHERPSDDKVSNWLPAPEGDFFVILRYFAPKESVRNGEYVPQGVKLVTD